MKNLLILLTALISCSAFSQKNMEIYNFSNHNFQFQLATNPISQSAAYPILDTGTTLYTLTPGQSIVIYTNSSTTGIPYSSPTSIPFITGWYRKNSSGGAYSFISNASAQAIFQNSQRWNFVKFSITGIPFSGTGYFGVPAYSSFSYYDPTTGTTVLFDTFQNGAGVEAISILEN